ncbi:unnamed protein product [Lactuca saligna]|uniref:Uncharacterized protein n=1 Tax=Lactuca saligna TaxID=75948 RepID=A0AA35ZY41_LACSI|nr:unnamed protein product [Lactuca saligna]
MRLSNFFFPAYGFSSSIGCFFDPKNQEYIFRIFNQILPKFRSIESLYNLTSKSYRTYFFSISISTFEANQLPVASPSLPFTFTVTSIQLRGNAHQHKLPIPSHHEPLLSSFFSSYMDFFLDPVLDHGFTIGGKILYILDHEATIYFMSNIQGKYPGVSTVDWCSM